MIKDVLADTTGAKVISALLGLGLAVIFRKTCKGDRCVVVNGPSKEVIDKYYFKLEDACYKYKPYAVNCETGNKTNGKSKKKKSRHGGEKDDTAMTDQPQQWQ